MQKSCVKSKWADVLNAVIPKFVKLSLEEFCIIFNVFANSEMSNLKFNLSFSRAEISFKKH